MEAYINEHKATLMKGVIYLIDENNVSIGAIKLSSYVKGGK
jgi:hypothetical protein